MSHELKVGDLYHTQRTEWPTAEQVRLSRTWCELTRFWPSPEPAEIRAHRSGPAQFALVASTPDVLMLAYQFERLSWSDAPFQASRMSGFDGWPGEGPSLPVMLRTVLVDSETGVIAAMRYDAWSVELSNAIRVAVAEQMLHEADDAAAGSTLDRLYAEYPSPEAMVRGCAIAASSSEAPELTPSVVGHF